MTRKMEVMPNKILHILLADDNKSEHVFFAHSLKYINESIKLCSITSGIALTEYLNNLKNPLPDILFLDVNMPIKNGKECLAELRADDRFADMPIVMYSTSDAQKDTDETFALGADLYVRKPAEIDELVSLLKAVLSVYEQDRIKHTSREHYVLVSSSDR